MLIITETRDGGTVHLVLDGELDLATHTDLTEALEKTWTADAVVIDCDRLKFCDSTGIITFLDAQDRARAGGIALRLTAVNGLVHRVLQVCGALTVLTAE
jgi:anti-anti-sigma factor